MAQKKARAKSNDGVKVASFKRTLRTFVKNGGLRDLPWRHTTDPYCIAVSECMLQQTQVSRVIPKYEHFLEEFPTVETLARAPLSKVITLWGGLGYNRRAKFLHALAKEVVSVHNGVFPREIGILQSLPGIGPYTARAIATFAYNDVHVFIETNIRSVFIHHFFSTTTNVSDAQILPFIAKTVDKKDPRVWYWTLMDYGSLLKAQGIRTHQKSAHYKKQSSFQGSRRQLRGVVLRLLRQEPLRLISLIKETNRDKNEVTEIIDDLIKEGFVVCTRGIYRLAGS